MVQYNEILIIHGIVHVMVLSLIVMEKLVSGPATKDLKHNIEKHEFNLPCFLMQIKYSVNLSGCFKPSIRLLGSLILT